MGKLLRRYWWPIAGASELLAGTARPVRLLSEDLVVFRARSGSLGLVDRRCPHRGADLANGIVEADGLRCSYHGWMFDRAGACRDAPFDRTVRPDMPSEKRTGLTAYDVKEHGGLVWAYLGPRPAPELPDWEFFHWRNGFRQIVISHVPCNWLQCQENSVDPVHFEWQHSNYSLRRSGSEAPYFPTHTKLEFIEFKYGIIYRRLRSNINEADPLWSTGRVCLWPNAVFPGNHIEYRVPIDDRNTLSIGLFFDRVPHEREPYVQHTIPTWHAPIFDGAGKVIDSHIINQDIMAWLGQGVIADRSRECLSQSDRGILMMRRRFLADLAALESDGRDPKGVIRDPAENNRIDLPVADRDQLINGLPLEQMIADPFLCERLRGFIFQYGQPEEVRSSFVDAMGLAGIGLPQRVAVDLLARPTK